ncbi:hypothetical protein JCM11641_006559 [Rhodosporidiobolus odoratus]
MLERPNLSINIGRRPSLLQTATLNAAVGSAPPSPLTGAPITPQWQNNAFDQYFPSALQTPPLASNGLFPPSGFPFPGRRGLLRRNSSLSSVSSSVAEEDDEDEPDWTEEEEDLVRRIYDACLEKHSRTQAPFALSGPAPPNFTNMVARTVLRAQNEPGRLAKAKTRATIVPRKPSFFAGSGDGDAESDAESEVEVELDVPAGHWKHGLKSTRLKIISLSKERQIVALEATPRQCDPEATPKRRKPLVRQDSMDFLPEVHNTAAIARLGNMLRQPSSDSLPLAAPAMSSSLSSGGAPPVAPSAFSHSSSRFRMQRTNSLQSIAGSPSQPKKATKADRTSSPEKQDNHKRLSRGGSESSVLPTPSMSRTLSFDPSQRNHQPTRPPLGASHSDPTDAITSTPSPTLLTPPPSSSKRTNFFNFLSSSPPKSSSASKRDSLTIDSALSFTGLKRPQSGLASAFHSPITGVFPSSPPPTASPKKKKAKRSSSPVRQPKLTKSREQSHVAPNPLATGPGLGFGGMEIEMEPASYFPIFSSPAPKEHGEPVTLLDPSVSSNFFSLSTSPSRRPSLPPPKLVLTPSLSPSSSYSSLSRSMSEQSSTGPSTPSVISPLSAAFNLQDLKLESKDEAEDAMALEEAEGQGLSPSPSPFLDQEYVKAGNEAKALRKTLGGFSWSSMV